MAKNKKQEECVHHWIINEPDGPTSEGVCKKCGAKKLFPNYMFADKNFKVSREPLQDICNERERANLLY